MICRGRQQSRSYLLEMVDTAVVVGLTLLSVLPGRCFYLTERIRPEQETAALGLSYSLLVFFPHRYKPHSLADTDAYFLL